MPLLSSNVMCTAIFNNVCNVKIKFNAIDLQDLSQNSISQFFVKFFYVQCTYSISLNL